MVKPAATKLELIQGYHTGRRRAKGSDVLPRRKAPLSGTPIQA